MKNRNKKNVILILIGITVIIITTLGIYSFGKTQINTGNVINRILTKFFDYNTIEIEYISKSIKSDISIFYENNCIYKNGVIHKGIENKYGWNCFDIFFQGNKKYTICHFKKNNWHVNSYIFEFNYIPDSLNVLLEIQGNDSKEELYYKYYKQLNDNSVIYFYDKEKLIYKIDTIK